MTIYRIAENVDFEILKGPLGAAVSGGVDSALMLYFMLKYTSDPVHIFTFASREKFLKNPMVSIAVISKCIELTGNSNVHHHISYGDSQNKINLFELPTSYLKSDVVHHMYTGVTKNPPADIVATFLDENAEHAERDPTIIRSTKSGKWYSPWTNLDKQDLFKIYKTHDLLDTLFAVTRSCEWENENKHGVDPQLSHCGKCWWCQERLWGFGNL